MSYWLLVLGLVIGLALIPLGLPGLWLMVAAAVVFQLARPTGGIGWLAIGISVALALVAEYLEFSLSARYTRKYGGSRRAGWGALLGGLVGAMVGIPVPIIGSVVAAFVGSFVGALLLEYTVGRDPGAAHRAAMGALVGRVASTAVKTGIGVAIGAIVAIRAFPRP